jgi:hypothetical protein
MRVGVFSRWLIHEGQYTEVYEQATNAQRGKQIETHGNHHVESERWPAAGGLRGYLSVSVYADGACVEHNAFTVPRRVLVPRIDRVDFSTSDAEPRSISSLRRLLLVVIFSSSSSHARTAFEGMRLRLAVGAVTPNGPVDGAIVAVEVAALVLLPPLLFMLVLLLRAEGRALDALRCRVGGMERAIGVCERRFDVVRPFRSAVT